MGVYRSPWESMGVHRSPLWESLGVHNRRGGDETDEFQRFLLRGVNGSPWGLGSPESMGVQGSPGESRGSQGGREWVHEDFREGVYGREGSL